MGDPAHGWQGARAGHRLKCQNNSDSATEGGKLANHDTDALTGEPPQHEATADALVPRVLPADVVAADVHPARHLPLLVKAHECREERHLHPPAVLSSAAVRSENMTYMR